MNQENITNENIMLNERLFIGKKTEERAIFPTVSNYLNQNIVLQHKDTLSCVLANLYLANKIERGYNKIQWIDYSRKKDFYTVKQASSGRRRGMEHYDRHHMTREKVCAVVDELLKAEFIHHQMGFHLENGDGKRSRMRANEFLEEMFTDATAFSAENAQRYYAYKSPIGELIILRDKNKNMQDYEDTCAVKSLRKNCALINETDFRHEFVLVEDQKLFDHRFEKELEKGHRRTSKSGKKPDFFSYTGYLIEKMESKLNRFISPRHHRVFNDSSFSLGGRFYCDLQNFDEYERSRILIDGEQSAELDYSGHHLRIIYALEGVKFEGDPYDIGVDVDRDVLKHLCLICINSGRRGWATYTFNEWLYENDIKLNIDSKQLVDRFEQRHDQIRKYFYSDYGKKAMYHDSRLAEKIMLEFVKRDKPIISIHDSFLVKEQDREMLREAMVINYVKMFGQIPVIK